MSKKFLDYTGLTYLWGKIKDLLSKKVDKVDGKGLSTNDYTTAEKTKLSGIETGANKTTIDATLTSTGTNPVQGKAIYTELGKKADTTTVNTELGKKVDKVTGKSLSTNDFTNDYKTKLDGIDSEANKTVVDASLSSTSTNPVQNKVVNTELGKKVDKVSGKGLSTNDFTNAYKTKLDNAASKSDISSVYKPKGTVAFASLPITTEALREVEVGSVYNVSDAFTTTNTFLEGTDKTYPAGTNVVCIQVDNIKMWDVLSGFVDLSSYQKEADLVAITNTEIDTILAA